MTSYSRVPKENSKFVYKIEIFYVTKHFRIELHLKNGYVLSFEKSKAAKSVIGLSVSQAAMARNVKTLTL